MIGLVILGIVLLITVAVFLFINFSPQFGGKATAERLEVYKKSGHFEKGIFVNLEETNMDIDIVKMTKEWFKKRPHKNPPSEIIPLKIDSTTVAQRNTADTKLTWFGHSAFLLEMDGKVILLDPMFGQYPAPHPWAGVGKRYSSELPLAIDKIPEIDFVVFSHDHYDHLDYGSVQALKDRVKMFFVPLGLENHLMAWGIEKERISVHNWWDETVFDHIKLVCAPARHFSGRGITDRSTTLWASWVIQGRKDKIYFSGDSGYGDHFSEIGDKYGPFDIAMMECGQYNEMWHSIHMMPEETAQAGLDVKADLVMPIHWGAFTLALHDWTDPAVRSTKKAQELGISITTPEIGEPIIVNGSSFPQSRWWEKY